MRSLRGISGALHLGIFEHPAKTYFFSSQLDKSSEEYGSVADGRSTEESRDLKKTRVSTIAFSSTSTSTAVSLRSPIWKKATHPVFIP